MPTTEQPGGGEKLWAVVAWFAALSEKAEAISEEVAERLQRSGDLEPDRSAQDIEIGRCSAYNFAAEYLAEQLEALGLNRPEEETKLNPSEPGGEVQRWTLYVCPERSCRYIAMEPGRCRSHPYPCRAMGPALELEEVVTFAQLQQERLMLGEAGKALHDLASTVGRARLAHQQCEEDVVSVELMDAAKAVERLRAVLATLKEEGGGSGAGAPGSRLKAVGPGAASTSPKRRRCTCGCGVEGRSLAHHSRCPMFGEPEGGPTDGAGECERCLCGPTTEQTRHPACPIHSSATPEVEEATPNPSKSVQGFGTDEVEEGA